jgi:hypothetical protein
METTKPTVVFVHARGLTTAASTARSAPCAARASARSAPRTRCASCAAKERLAELSPAELRKVRDHERRNAHRKSILAAIEKGLR